MSTEERAKRKIELNNELNKCKKKWNILEANRCIWNNIKYRLQNGQNKSKKTVSYNLCQALINSILASVFLILPITIPFAIALFLISGCHFVKTIIYVYYFLRLKKGVETTEKINDKYINKKLEVEENEELIYKQLNQLNEFPMVSATTPLIERCIERTSISNIPENDLQM